MNDESKRIERRQYASEFKTEAINLVFEQSYTCGKVDKQLRAAPKMLANWFIPIACSGNAFRSVPPWSTTVQRNGKLKKTISMYIFFDERRFFRLGRRDGFQRKYRWLADGRPVADLIMYRYPDDGDSGLQLSILFKFSLSLFNALVSCVNSSCIYGCSGAMR